MDLAEPTSCWDMDFSHTKALSCPSFDHRRSPIFVTLSDPNTTLVDIQKLMEAGVNLIRFKTSHLTKQDKIYLLGKVDKAAKMLSQKHATTDWPVATAVELKTCIVKTGLLQNQEHPYLKEGSKVTLTCDLKHYNACTENIIFVDNPYLTSDVKVDMEITIEQDEIILQCKEIVDENSVQCIVIKSGKLGNLCNVCIRGGKHTQPYITQKDLRIVQFALGYQVDMIIVNYSRHVDTIKLIKQFIGTKLRPIIIAGICTAEGLGNVDDIIRESDGILFSREYLTYELEGALKYKMNQIQKSVGAKCLKAGKPFYISGGVFRHAILTGHICTRDIFDVSNAILDGTTGFVLKECDRPDTLLEVVKSLSDLCRSMEPFVDVRSAFRRTMEEVKMPANAAEAIAMSCVAVANQTNAKAIILPTVTGRTAKCLLWVRPNCIIITVSNRTRTIRLLSTYRCVVSLMYNGTPQSSWSVEMDNRINFALELAVKKGWLQFKDTYVVLQKYSDVSSFCDTVKVGSVNIYKKPTVECEDEEET